MDTLLTHRPLARRRAAPPLPGAGRLRRWWARLCLTEDQRYLLAAHDLADLERRQRRLERHGLG